MKRATPYQDTPMVRLVSAALAEQARYGKRAVDVADEIGVKPNLISMVKRGVTAVPLERAAALALALLVPLDTLLLAGRDSYRDNRSWIAMGLAIELGGQYSTSSIDLSNLSLGRTAPDYLRDLAERLMRVPPSYGTDQGDVEQLSEIADRLSSAQPEEAP